VRRHADRRQRDDPPSPWRAASASARYQAYHTQIKMRTGLLQVRIAALITVLAAGMSAFGHEETAQAGEAGRPSRTVHVTMREAGTKMLSDGSTGPIAPS
jgi:hypothetical protein